MAGAAPVGGCPAGSTGHFGDAGPMALAMERARRPVDNQRLKQEQEALCINTTSNPPS
jgi:hypothetical protein